MGILDDLTETLSRGAGVTTRTAQIIKLKAQIADLNNQRNTICSQLGAALYDKVKDNPEFTAGLEEVFEGIDNCDKRIAALQKQIDALEEENTVKNNPPEFMRECPNCGYRLGEDALFCSRCGSSAPTKDPAKAAPKASPCQPIDIDPS